MAYTKQTWADGKAGATPVNAAALNHMEAGIGAATVIGDFPVAFLRQTAGQAMTASTWMALTWGVADIDSHSGWSSTTNTSRWTVPANQGGTYRVDGAMFANGVGFALCRVEKNGVILLNSWADGGQDAAGGQTGATTQRILTLVPGDYVEIWGYVDTAVSLRNTTSDGGGAYFMVERIR